MMDQESGSRSSPTTGLGADRTVAGSSGPEPEDDKSDTLQSQRGRKYQHSEELPLPVEVVIKAEYIPESGGVKCMICYTTVTDADDSIVAEEERSASEMPHPKLPTIYRSLGVKVSSRMKSFYEEFKPPLCSVCLETSQKAKAVVDQLDELEKTLNTIGELIKEKLITSYENRQQEQDVYNEDPMEGLCNRMITVNQIREDVMKDIYKRSAAAEKKLGRLKSNTTSEKTEVNKDRRDRRKKPHPSSRGQDIEDPVEEKFQIQTASGRVIKRPKFYVDKANVFANNYSSESEEEETPLEVILEEGKEGDTTAEMNDFEETPDPEWSPGHVASSDHEMESSSSESEDSESELLIKEEAEDNENDSDSKDELLDRVLPVLQDKKKRKKRRVRSRVAASTPKKKVSVKIPVKVVADDGEEFDGVFRKLETKDVEENLIEEPTTSVEPGAAISINDKLISQIRIKCSETGCVHTFSDIPRMKLHVLQKHRGIENPYSCTSCDKAFARRSLLKIHMKQQHRKVAEVNPAVKKYRACEFEGCLQKYRNRSELLIHVRKVHTNERPFKCDYCDQGFISALKREFHVEITHIEIPPLKCEHCPRGFFRKHRLREHIKSHTKERSYLCEICSKSFSQPAYLRYHQTQHKELELEPYKCDQCDRTFATPVNLRIHQQTQHMKEYRFHCEICNHGATHMSHLRLHMRTHSGDRPYRCDQCDKSFTRGSQLKIHIRSHTGERPYQCDLCDKNFTNSSKLRRHELTHSVEKPHKCPTCGRGFSQLTNLNSHVKSAHNKDKPSKKPTMNDNSSVQAPVFQPHQIFGNPHQNLPDLPMQFHMVNNEGVEGTVPSYAEFIILNQQV